MTAENSYDPCAVPDDVLHHDEDADGRRAISSNVRVTAALVYTVDRVIETLTRYREHRGFGNIPKSLQLLAACVSAIAAISALVNHRYLIAVLIVTSLSLIFGGCTFGNWRIQRNYRTSPFADEKLTVACFRLPFAEHIMSPAVFCHIYPSLLTLFSRTRYP